MLRDESDHRCPPSHSHGENSTCRSVHHCKCDECREFAREYEFWRQAQLRRGKALLIDATGTQRRIHALHRIGYSQRAVATMAGRSEGWVTHLGRVDKVKPDTAKLIAGIYDKLSMTPAEGATPTERGAIEKCKRYAVKAGWAGPLDWNEGEIDDPDATPTTAERDTNRAAYLLDELEHFRGIGESPVHAATAIGRTPHALARLADRHQRRELARWIEKAEQITRTEATAA